MKLNRKTAVVAVSFLSVSLSVSAGNIPSDMVSGRQALIEVPASTAVVSSESAGENGQLQQNGEMIISGEGTDIANLRFDARFDYQRDWQHSKVVKSNTGFEGKYFNILVDGTIVPGLTYAWRHRLNKSMKDSNFFDATDYLYVRYEVGPWLFTAGKEVVSVGGMEYDIAPINVFGCSVFCYNMPSYQVGVSVGYNFSNRDQLKFHVTQSPFHTSANRNMYAYNLYWTGHHGIFHALWSANMTEYRDSRYISYLALGNRLDLNPVEVEVDFMNRAAAHQKFLFRDCSVMAQVACRPTRNWRVFAKYTYDVNRSGTDADLTVLDGTELQMIGAGVEYYPLRKKFTSLRLHADCFYSWGRNANADNLMQNRTVLLDFGVTWYMNVLSVKHKNKIR